MSTPDLDRENTYALLAQRALLGNVSPDLYGAAFDVVGTRVTFYFLVHARSDTLDNDLDKISATMANLMSDLETSTNVRTVVDVESDDRWIGKQHRMIFLRREIGFDG